MGDNRYNSTDSRDSRVGTVDIDSILGKVILRFFPFDKFGTVN
jgi:signal peptidase I